VKRLSACFDDSDEAWRAMREAQADAWEAEETRWREIGLEPLQVLLFLREAGRARAGFERALLARRKPLPRFLTHQGEEVRRLLDGAMQFLDFIAHARDHRGRLFFGRHGKEVQRLVTEYRKRYLLDHKGPPLARPPRGRPGETWLAPYALALAREWRKRGQSWRATIKAIYDALVLAGHANMVTHDLVRGIIRKERKRDPCFGQEGGREKS
jgi:hypothetical protein